MVMDADINSNDMKSINGIDVVIEIQSMINEYSKLVRKGSASSQVCVYKIDVLREAIERIRRIKPARIRSMDED